MSEARKKLIDMLSALNNEDKAWVINMLVQQLAGMDCQRKKARKVHNDDFSDKQWDAYFEEKTALPLSENRMYSKEILSNTSGRGITPMQKWL